MKPLLVVGLGNRLVPEDSAGLRVFEMLRAACAAKPDVEFLEGGTDLLRLTPRLRDRRLVLLVDAAHGCDRAITLLEHGIFAADADQSSAHALCAVQALELVRWSDEMVRHTPCYWLLIDATQAV